MPPSIVDGGEESFHGRRSASTSTGNDAYEDRSGSGCHWKHLDARSGERFESSLDQSNAFACFDGGDNARAAVMLFRSAGPSFEAPEKWM